MSEVNDMRKRSVRIEKRPGGNYSVVKVREDGLAWSVGLTSSKTKAKKIKKKHLWGK